MGLSPLWKRRSRYILSHCVRNRHHRITFLPLENMFYSHALSLPFFCFLVPDIWNHLGVLVTLPPAYTIAITDTIEVEVPYFTLLLINLTSQYGLPSIATTSSPHWCLTVKFATDTSVSVESITSHVKKPSPSPYQSFLTLTTSCNAIGLSTSLTCTFTITVRKFVSLIFSVLYFRNPFTVYHWVGTALVFGGTGLYSTSASVPVLVADKHRKHKKTN